MTYFTDIEVIRGMPAAEYFARPEISRSELVSLLDCPARFPWSRAHPIDPTAAMVLGTRVHELVLEGIEPLDGAIIVKASWCLTAKGEPAKSPKATKTWKTAAETAEASGVDIYLDTEAKPIIEEVRLIAAEVNKHLGHIVDGCETEVAVFATHAETGVRVKARLDALADNYVADLKTTKAADAESFARSIGNYRYDIQAAFYGDLAGSLAGTEHLPFVFACVETSEPYLTAVWDLDEDWIENGRADYERALSLYKKYEAEGYPATLGKGTLSPKPWQIG